MIDIYLFIQWNRARKKLTIYKKLAMISFDMTVIFYMLLIVGYMLFAIISEGNFVTVVQSKLGFLENLELKEFSYMLLVIPLVYLLRGFSHPGVKFSNTEYTLTLQPVTKLHLWWVLAAGKWLRATIVYTIIGLIYGVFAATPASDVILYVLLLVGLHIAMTPLQWKFFQLSIWKKLAGVLVLIVVDGFIIVTDIMYVVSVLALLLFLVAIICLPQLMKQIDWEKVTAAVDFKIWNMHIISHVTKVKFQKPRRYTIWQRMRFYKKPFNYEKNGIYHRLWQLHIEKHKLHIIRLAGVLLLFLLVTAFLKAWLFLIALFVMTQVYNEMIAALFRDMFREEIVQIVPWDVEVYRNTFLVWAFFISGIFLIPGVVYIMFHPSLISAGQIMLFALFFAVQLTEMLNKQMHLIDTIFAYDERNLHLCVAGMAFTFLSLFHVLFVVLALVSAAVVVARKFQQRSL